MNGMIRKKERQMLKQVNISNMLEDQINIKTLMAFEELAWIPFKKNGHHACLKSYQSFTQGLQ